MKKNYFWNTLLKNKFSLSILLLLLQNVVSAQFCKLCEMPNWTYQNVFVVDNSVNPDELTDFPVQVRFNTKVLIEKGYMQATGADIRVSKKCDGSDPLEFWFDDLNTDETKLWVKMPVVEANKKDTIFVHYGNNSASSLSSASDVFTYHADFESGDLSDWSFDPDGGTWALDVIDGENVLSCTNPPSGNGTAAVLSTDLGVSDYIIEMEFYAFADGNMGGVLYEHDDFDNYSSYHLMTGADMTMSSIITNNSPNYSLTESFVSEPKVWYDWTVVRRGSDNSVDIYIDGQLQRTLPTSFTNGIGAWSYGGGVIYYDNIFVRKYSANEPTVSEYSLDVVANTSIASPCKGDKITLTGSGADTYEWDNNIEDGVEFQISASQTYTVTGSLDNGCKDMGEISLSVIEVSTPVISQSTSDDRILMSSSVEGNQWYLNNAKLDGAIEQSYTAQVSGQYTLKTTSQNCESDESESVTVSIVTALIDDRLSGVSIKPNPVLDVMSISFEAENVEYQIIDAVGTVLISGTAPTKNHSVNVESLHSGLYFIVVNDGMKGVQQFVKN